MASKQEKIIAAASVVLGFALVAVPALATTIVPACALVKSAEPPSLDCVMQVFRNVASLIIGVTGTFALLMFVYGGFEMITSAGNDKKVSKGKEIIRNAVIGIVLIFLAGYVIDYVYLRMTKGRTLRVENEACNDGKGAYNLSSGVPICETPCSAMSDQGYSCMDSFDGRDCNESYIGCGNGASCCIPATGEELDAIDEAAGILR